MHITLTSGDFVNDKPKATASMVARNGINPGATAGPSPLEQVTAALNKKTEELQELQRTFQGKEKKLSLRLADKEHESEHQQALLAESTKNEERLLILLNEKGLELARHQGQLETLIEREKNLSRSLTEKEVELQRDRAELHARFAERELALRQEMESQQAALKEREASFRSQSDELLKRTRFLESEQVALKEESKQRAIEHEQAKVQLQRQKEQFQEDFQARMESKATEYVDTALESLKASEKRFDRIGFAWSVGGIFSVGLGLALAYFLAVEATEKLVANKDISWGLILFFGTKGAILLGLVVATVRLCVGLARNYMHESLKNAERRHAINYGKFYLSVYGAGTDGQKLQDVFAHWNISGTSAFSAKDEPLPQPTMSEITDLAKVLIGLKKSEKSSEKD
jgi:hypothetical protein